MWHSLWRPTADFSLHAVSSATAQRAGGWHGARALPAASRRAPVPPHPSMYNCAGEHRRQSWGADTCTGHQRARGTCSTHGHLVPTEGAAPCVSSARSGHACEETTLSSFSKNEGGRKIIRGNLCWDNPEYKDKLKYFPVTARAGDRVSDKNKVGCNNSTFPMALAPFISRAVPQPFRWQRTKALGVAFSFAISQLYLCCEMFVEVHCVPRAED